MKVTRTLFKIVYRLSNICPGIVRRRTSFYLIACLLFYVYWMFSTSEETCFQWSTSQRNHCFHDRSMRNIIWTHDASGVMKYLQWIRIRKLASIRITYLNPQCQILNEEQDFSFNRTNDISFTQVYILPLFMDLTNQSICSLKINARLNKHRYQIYFKRKSLLAMWIYQQLDHNSLPMSSSNAMKQLSAMFLAKNHPIVHSEDLIHENIFASEKSLISFLQLIRLTVSREILDHDAHYFLHDATWWDRSDVAERVANLSIPARANTFSYIDDFYYLSGNRTFRQYLRDSRRCIQSGIFPQLPGERHSHNRSRDRPDRCVRKAFDCAFSDIYSFADREEFYRKTPFQSAKCGFLQPTIFDEVRRRYYRNTTCQTIILTLITDCYDPLPVVQDAIPPDTCFVALLDTKTIDHLEAFYEKNADIPRVTWDIIDLGTRGTPFSFAAKSVETLKALSFRLFPLAKWIVWVDGKAHIGHIKQLLIEIQAPILAAPHADVNRTSETEAEKTTDRLYQRETYGSIRLNHSLEDLHLQRTQYQSEGFYARAHALQLTMFDIGIFIYRNHHPCIWRYLCAWHNEMNYYSYRGQVSVYYPAERLNLTDYMQYLSLRFHIFDVHHSLC